MSVFWTEQKREMKGASSVGCECIQPRIGCDEDPGGCLPPASARRRVRAPDKRPLSSLLRPCWVSHSRCPLIKLQPCSLLSCWQTKVLKRTPSVIASNLSHNVLFHVKRPGKKGSACSLPSRPRCNLHTFTFLGVHSSTAFTLRFVSISRGRKRSRATFIVTLGDHSQLHSAAPGRESTDVALAIKITEFRKIPAALRSPFLHLWPGFCRRWASGSLQLEVFPWLGQVSLCPAWDKAAVGAWAWSLGAERAELPLCDLKHPADPPDWWSAVIDTLQQQRRRGKGENEDVCGGAEPRGGGVVGEDGGHARQRRRRSGWEKRSCRSFLVKKYEGPRLSDSIPGLLASKHNCI